LDAISFFQPFFMAIAILTMLSGAIGGLMQRTLKRVIAYSSVTATGYFLLILSCNNFYGLVSFFVFLVTYAIALFAVFVFISQPVLHGKSFISFFDDLENYYKTNKVISFMLSSFFFSLGGIPPFIGFIGKFEMLGSLFFNGYFAAFLAFLIISTISFLYYARIVKALYTKDINTFLYIENFSFFNSVVIVFCFLFLLIGFFYSGSLHLFAQLLVFNLVSV
jgi:NADH:ubiquinone oxidoreductase subunit 2 (subunit N)